MRGIVMDLFVVMAAIILLAAFLVKPEAPQVGAVQATVSWPYAGKPGTEFIITQWEHGDAYGHKAIDIAAGQGREILAPESGAVREVGIDEYGNTYLRLDSKKYIHLFLHGDYIVSEGSIVQKGALVGYESNHGYTICTDGVLSAGRPCGYHTHWATFLADSGEAIFPGELLSWGTN